MSLGTFGHQVTPESGRAGPMGGRLSNWIDNGAQMTPHSSLHKRGIGRERARINKRVNVQKSLLAKNGSVQIDVRVQLGLSERGCRPQRRRSARTPPSLVRRCKELEPACSLSVRSARLPEPLYSE